MHHQSTLEVAGRIVRAPEDAAIECRSSAKAISVQPAVTDRKVPFPASLKAAGNLNCKVYQGWQQVRAPLFTRQ